MSALLASYAHADGSFLKVPLELIVNSVDQGTAIALLDGSHILLARADLLRKGITVIDAVTQVVNGRDYFELSSLAPRVTFKYDDRTLTLTLTVDPTLLGRHEFDVSSRTEPAEMIRGGSPSAFLNYALNAVAGNATQSANLFLEQGVSYHGAFLDNSFTLDSTGRAIRGLTSVTIDNPQTLTRLVIGDTTAAAGALGGAAPMAAVSYGNNFAIDPYFVPYPTQQYAGVVNTPSTADIYVNGQLVKTLDLPPGQFNLLNIPATVGAGITRVVLRDAFGQQQQIGVPYYHTVQLLREGLQQYSYDLGVLRSYTAPGTFGSYAVPALSALHLYGISDDLTAGGFLQAEPSLAVGGPDLMFASRLGQFGVFGAASTVRGVSGWSSSAQYSYQSTIFSVGTDMTYQSASFANLSQTPVDDRERILFDLLLSARLGGDFDVLAVYSHGRYRDAGENDKANLTLIERLGKRLNIGITAGRSRSEHAPIDNYAFVSVSCLWGGSSNATLSSGRQQAGQQSTLQIQKSLPLGVGYGYSIQAQTGGQAVQILDAEYQAPFGAYEVNANDIANQTTTRVSLSGSLIAIGGDFKASRAVSDAYALVRVPGVADVSTSLSNQAVGKTDKSGDVLVPNLLSYYGNRLSIDDQNIPIDYTIDATEKIIAPPYRGGSVVEFPVRRLQVFTGTLLVGGADEGVPIVPAYGELTLRAAGKIDVSPIGAHGEFYFDGLSRGPHEATVVFDGGQCAFTFMVGDSQDRFVKMNPIICAQKSHVRDAR